MVWLNKFVYLHLVPVFCRQANKSQGRKETLFYGSKVFTIYPWEAVFSEKIFQDHQIARNEYDKVDFLPSFSNLFLEFWKEGFTQDSIFAAFTSTLFQGCLGFYFCICRDRRLKILQIYQPYTLFFNKNSVLWLRVSIILIFLLF